MDLFSILVSTSSVVVAIIVAYFSRKKKLKMETELQNFLERKEKIKQNYVKKSEDLHFH